MLIDDYILNFKDIPVPVARPLWERDYLSMITHTRGDNRTEIIRKRRPNEPEEVNKYRIENYRPVTRHPFNQAITNLQRTISHSHVEITYPEDIREYLQDNNFEDKDLLGFFHDEFIRKMIEMANGRLVWWPVGIGDVTRFIDMVPIFVNPRDIHHDTPEVFTFLSDEKSEVEFNSKKVWQGEVYYTILEGGLYKRIQVGKKTEQKFEWEEYYSNPTGVVYDLIMGGDPVSATIDPTIKNPFDYDRHSKHALEIDYLSSFFSSSLAYADELIGEFSDNQGVRVRTNFPLRQIEVIDCGVCTNGWINEITDDGPVRHKCNACTNGKVTVGISPYGDIIRPERKDSPMSGNDQSDYDMVKFLHPAVDILKFGWDTVKDMKDMVKDSLNMKYIEEAQSAVAKQADREDKESTLNKIAKHVYGVMRNSVQIIYKFRYPDRDWPVVQINFPESFIPKTVEELNAELKSLKDQGAPTVLIAEKTRELMSKSFSGDPLRMKIYDINTLLDPYIALDTEEKARLQSLGSISREDLQTSAVAASVIRRYADENPNFLEIDNDKILADVTGRIRSIISAVPSIV